MWPFDIWKKKKDIIKKRKRIIAICSISGVCVATAGIALPCVFLLNKSTQLDEFIIDHRLEDSTEFSDNNTFFWNYTSKKFVLSVRDPMPNVKYEFVLNADSITGNYLKISNENSIEATLTLQPGLATGDYTYSIKVIATKQNGKNELTFNYKLKIVNEIPNFNINDNTPQIKYGYTTKTWYATTNVVSGVNIAYSLNNLSDQLNDKLTIDPNTGELTLTQGLGVLDGSSHSYTIRANATYPGVFSKTITKTINFGVVKGDIENLLIDSISWPTIEYGYSECFTTLTNNILSLAPDYVGTTSYEIINNIYGNRLNIEDDKLILSTGLDVGTYYFSLRVSASGDNNWNAKQSDNIDFSFVVDRTNFTSTTFTNTMVNECDYHSETRGMVSLTDAPEDTYFGLANVSENLRPYLTIDASTGEIFLASGADVDNYSYQVTATIENNNYFENTITSGIYALEIKQINFDTSSYTISNNLADECNYSTQLTGAATFNGDLLTNTQIEWTLIDKSTNIDSFLSINAITGAISLIPGCDIGEYSYKVKATITHQNFITTSIISNEYSLEINRIPHINNYTIENTLASTCSYGQTISGTCSLSSQTPNGTTITWSLMDMTSGLENYLSINPSTGEISLTAGLDSNTEPYRYTIKVNLVFVNYDSKNVTLEQSITVNLATFAPTYTFNNSLQTTYTYGTTGSGTVSISSLPSATSVEYSLDSVDSGLSGNLSINPASGDISLTSGVVYKETPYTYKIKAQLTNINYEFRVVLSSVQNLSIVKSNALASFTMSTSNSVLTARISSGYSAFNIPLTHTYSSPPSGTTFTFQKVSGDGKAVINGSNLKVDAGLASGSYVVNVNCTASNSNYNSKTTPNIAITIKVASGNINPTNTNNYSAPKFGTDDSYHPSKPFLGTGMWSSPNESVPYPNNIGQQTISAIELAIDFQATRFITSYTLRSRGTVGEWTPSAWTLKTNAGVQVDARDNIIWSASQSQTFSLGVQLQPNTYSDSVFIFRFTKVYRSAVNTAELWCGFSPTCYIYGMSL